MLAPELPHHPRIPPSTVGRVLARWGAKGRQIDLDATILDALAALKASGEEAVLVMENDVLIAGIFSGRELAQAALGDAFSLRIPVRAAMAHCVVQASPDEIVEPVLELLDEHDKRFLPVVDRGILGLIRREDLLRESVSHHVRVFQAQQLDHRIQFWRGTYSC